MKQKMMFLNLLFVLLCSHNIYPQKNYCEVYYPIISQAEMDIVNNKYEDALSKYQQAFANVDKVFAKDYHNALVCAIKTANYSLAFNFAEKLILKGYTLEKFRIAPFDVLIHQEKWNNLTNKYDKLRKKYLSSINQSVINQLIALKEKDQYFRVKEGSYKIYRDTIDKIDVKNVADLKKVIDKYGFPSEDLIGIYDSAHHQPYWLIIHHDIQNKRYDFLPILREATKQGEFSPRYLTFMEDLATNFDNRQGYGHTAFIRINNKVIELNIYYNESLLNMVNKNRMSLGLESFSEYRQKVLFQLHHPEFIIIDYNPYNATIGYNEQDEKKQLDIYLNRLKGKIVYDYDNK